jgi:3-hydroxybutyryl-CoA dehydrogenase
MSDSLKPENIKLVAVVGAGTMGAQIAQTLSQVGKYTVMFTSTSLKSVARGMNTITGNLERYYVNKGLMTQADMDEVLGRIKSIATLEEAVREVDFVLEAVYENLELKKDIFRQLGEYTPAGAILASTTSDFNITEIAGVSGKPDKVVGMHFFHPASTSKAIEIVRGSFTSDDTMDAAVALTRYLGKEPLLCKDFSYGFLANRAYTPMVLEAVQMVWERVASPTDIDKALKLGYGLPIGPLELFDLLGIWKIQVEAEADKIQELGEKGRLHPLIRMMGRAGYVGGRSKGIYAFYDEVLEPKKE